MLVSLSALANAVRGCLSFIFVIFLRALIPNDTISFTEGPSIESIGRWSTRSQPNSFVDRIRRTWADLGRNIFHFH